MEVWYRRWLTQSNVELNDNDEDDVVIQNLLLQLGSMNLKVIFNSKKVNLANQKTCRRIEYLVRHASHFFFCHALI
jgi:hypothetical protein